MALGDEAALQDYESAMAALQRNDYAAAERALFGEYNAGDQPGVVNETNPKGLIPKMLSRLVGANGMTSKAAMTALKEAHEKFNELVKRAQQRR